MYTFSFNRHRGPRRGWALGCAGESASRLRARDDADVLHALRDPFFRIRSSRSRTAVASIGSSKAPATAPRGSCCSTRSPGVARRGRGVCKTAVGMSSTRPTTIRSLRADGDEPTAPEPRPFAIASGVFTCVLHRKVGRRSAKERRALKMTSGNRGSVARRERVTSLAGAGVSRRGDAAGSEGDRAVGRFVPSHSVSGASISRSIWDDRDERQRGAFSRATRCASRPEAGAARLAATGPYGRLCYG